MQADCELIYKHYVELDELDKRRHKRDDKGNKPNSKKNDADKDALLQGAEGDEEPVGGDVDKDGAIRKMVMQNLTDDATKTNLPEIDISEAVAQVDEFKKKMNQSLDRISGKLDVLKQQALDIGDTLDKQNVMIDKLNEKTDKTNVELDKANERLKKQITATSQTTIYIVVIVGIILLIILVIVAYVLITQLFGLGSII